MAKIIRLWRHRVTFDSQTITMISIAIFSDRIVKFSALKHFESILHMAMP